MVIYFALHLFYTNQYSGYERSERDGLDLIISFLTVMMAPALFGVLLWAISRPFRKARHLSSGRFYEPALLVWLIFLSILLGLTLTPAGFWPALMRGELPSFPPAFRGGINLEPFHSSWELLQFYIRHKLWGAVLINFPGNIIMFMPVGFFAALFSHCPKWWKSTLVTGFLSLSIELLQLFVSRGTDIDDLILNTLGGLLGFWVFYLVKRMRPHWVQSCSKQ